MPGAFRTEACPTSLTARCQELTAGNVFPIPPVTLPVGTKIFGGAILRQSGFQTPASVDLNSPHNNSWLRGWDPSVTPDPNNMGTNQFGQPAMINLQTTVVPGVFMIRLN